MDYMEILAVFIIGAKAFINVIADFITCGLSYQRVSIKKEFSDLFEAFNPK
jgi:hypothetical protein